MADVVSTAATAPTTSELFAIAAVVEKLTTEGTISMRQAAKIYSPTTHKSTPTRHAVKGVQLADGTVLKLESFRLGGGQVVTSRPAVLRFLVALQSLRGDATPAPTPLPRSASQRAAASSAADAELDALGVK